MFKGLFKKGNSRTDVVANDNEQRCYEVAGEILKAVLEKIPVLSEISEISINEDSGSIYYEDNSGVETMVYKGSISHSQAVALEWVLWNETRHISQYKMYYGGDGKRVHHRPNRPNDGDYTNVSAPKV